MAYSKDVKLQALDQEFYALLKELASVQHRTMKMTAELLIKQAADNAGLIK